MREPQIYFSIESWVREGEGEGVSLSVHLAAMICLKWQSIHGGKVRGRVREREERREKRKELTKRKRKHRKANKRDWDSSSLSPNISVSKLLPPLLQRNLHANSICLLSSTFSLSPARSLCTLRLSITLSQVTFCALQLSISLSLPLCLKCTEHTAHRWSGQIFFSLCELQDNF